MPAHVAERNRGAAGQSSVRAAHRPPSRPNIPLAGSATASFPQVVETVENASQRIVDFVRHPCGELSDRGQFLRISDLLLQFLGLRHVARNAQHAQDRALDPMQRGDTHHHSPRLSRASHHFDLIDLLRADIQGALETPPSMALGQKGKVRTPEQIVLPISPCFDLTVDIGKPLLGIECVDDVVGVLEQILQILFGLFDFAGALP